MGRPLPKQLDLWADSLLRIAGKVGQRLESGWNAQRSLFAGPEGMELNRFMTDLTPVDKQCILDILVRKIHGNHLWKRARWTPRGLKLMLQLIEKRDTSLYIHVH